jgi:enoyl-CoA hydratase/carnithine racemase
MPEKPIFRSEQSSGHFLWSVDQGVATITLNRSERNNPLTF